MATLPWKDTWRDICKGSCEKCMFWHFMWVNNRSNWLPDTYTTDIFIFWKLPNSLAALATNFVDNPFCSKLYTTKRVDIKVRIWQKNDLL